MNIEINLGFAKFQTNTTRRQVVVIAMLFAAIVSGYKILILGDTDGIVSQCLGFIFGAGATEAITKSEKIGAK